MPIEHASVVLERLIKVFTGGESDVVAVNDISLYTLTFAGHLIDFRLRKK
jgi:hypothetical protein